MPPAAAKAKNPENFSKADKGQLRQHVDAIDAIEGEIHELRQSLAELYKSAEGEGFAKLRIREVIRRRKKRRKVTKAALDNAQLEFELYWAASGGDEAVETVTDDERPVMDRGGRGFN